MRTRTRLAVAGLTLVAAASAATPALADSGTDRTAVWSWTELTRAVDGCKTATILYDATYAIPSEGFTQRAYTSVSYTYKRGKWLSVIDQGTRVAGT